VQTQKANPLESTNN